MQDQNKYLVPKWQNIVLFIEKRVQCSQSTTRWGHVGMVPYLGLSNDLNSCSQINLVCASSCYWSNEYISSLPPLFSWTFWKIIAMTGVTFHRMGHPISLIVEFLLCSSHLWRAFTWDTASSHLSHICRDLSIYFFPTSLTNFPQSIGHSPWIRTITQLIISPSKPNVWPSVLLKVCPLWRISLACVFQACPKRSCNAVAFRFWVVPT